MSTDNHCSESLADGDAPLACQPTARYLAAWVDGGLQGDEARLVTRHLAHCQRCEQEAQALREILGDLHAALADRAGDDRGAQFWQTMAANIDAAVAHTPQEPSVSDASNVVVLPGKRWRTVAWAVSGALAAAVLAVFAVHTATNTAGQPITAARTPDAQWTDALQARMSIEDDPASGDSDPIDDLEDLNDDEVQELATQLGEEG